MMRSLFESRKPSENWSSRISENTMGRSQDLHNSFPKNVMVQPKSKLIAPNICEVSNTDYCGAIGGC